MTKETGAGLGIHEEIDICVCSLHIFHDNRGYWRSACKLNGDYD